METLEWIKLEEFLQFADVAVADDFEELEYARHSPILDEDVWPTKTK